MSAQIQAERSAYYEALERSQKGTLDITSWLKYFFGVLDRAFARAEGTLTALLHKARLWEKFWVSSLNDATIDPRPALGRLRRQADVLQVGQARKCSQDTALRDIQDLVRRGILVKDPQGGPRSSYSLASG